MSHQVTNRGASTTSRAPASLMDSAAEAFRHQTDFDLNQTCDIHTSRFDCPDALIAAVGESFPLNEGR